MAYGETDRIDCGRRSVAGRMRKRRTGACMRRVSNGRDLVGGWYRRSAMFEYKRTSVRMARKMVERTKICRD